MSRQPTSFSSSGYRSGARPLPVSTTSQPGRASSTAIGRPIERIRPAPVITATFLFVAGIEVLGPREADGIVTFGDSLTEGKILQLDANNRWPDQLARRLAVRPGGRQLGVVNQGIGGARLLHDGHCDSGLRRFDRDVLAQPGATHVIAALGVNDLRNSQGRADEIVTAGDLIGGCTSSPCGGTRPGSQPSPGR